MCRSRRLEARCDLPPIPQAALDEQSASHSSDSSSTPSTSKPRSSGNVIDSDPWGHLTAIEVPALNAQLAKVFDEFRITCQGQRVIVEPRLRAEWQPEGDWRSLDFGEPDQSGAGGSRARRSGAEEGRSDEGL